MGISPSKIADETTEFELTNTSVKELSQLNKIINDILTTSKTFKNNNMLNSLVKKKCDRFVFSSQDKLLKYSKVYLNELNTSISLIPEKQYIKDKQYLCKKISLYYSRLLNLLLLIKYVYDLENFGSYNIAGIVDKNIKQTKQNIKLKMCNTSQPQHQVLDMNQLSGFEYFVENFLSPKEQQSFMKIYQDIFNLKNVNNIDEMLCVRRILENDVENIIFLKETECKKSKDNTFEHIMDGDKRQTSIMKIHPKNPILSWKYCSDISELDCKTNNNTHEKLSILQTNYKKNLNNVLDILDDIVFFNKKTSHFQIKQISSDKLHFLEKRLKQNILQFYIKSIYDYKAVLQSCMK